MEELISLIVPVYNAEKYLPRFFSCIRKQTYDSLEVLLIDDGSTDNSGIICDRYAQEDSRAKVYHLLNGGVAKARNYGLHRYTGKYLMFADADDLFSSSYVQRLYDLITSSDVHVAACMAYNTKDIGIQDYECEEEYPPEEWIWGEIDYTDRASHRVVWGAIYDRYAIENIFFDERYTVATDTLFFAEVSRHVQRYLLIRDPLYCYVIYENSLSHRKFDRMRYDEIRIWENIYDLCPENSLSKTSCVKALIRKYQRGMGELLRENRDPELFQEMCTAVKRHRIDKGVYSSKKNEWKSRLFLRYPAMYMRLKMLKKRLQSIT